jgi:AcrR family transcriptional regulator
VSEASARLPAAERRQAILETAVRVFTSGSYRGCTTAEIARAAGISEPILYRHFGSKRDLYLAVLDYVWTEVARLWDEAVAAEPDPERWIQAVARVSLMGVSTKLVLPELWVQALSEAGDDEELRRYLRKHIREVHDHLADLMRRGQEAGVIVAERDIEAEAWITLAGGLLGTIGRRVGLLVEEDFVRIRASRVEWLSGRQPEASQKR